MKRSLFVSNPCRSFCSLRDLLKSASATMAALDSEPQQIVIAIPIFDNMTVLDAIGPYESLTRLPNVVVRFVSHKVGLVTADSGTLSLQATHSFDDLPRPDIIIVPGGNGANTLAAAGDRPILDWIINAHETTLFTTSVCTGAMLLGAAGLLKGLEATTHWTAYQELASYGAIISRQRVVCQGKIITAAGVSSGIDLGIRLAALLTDEETAKAAQLSIEYDPEPPYDVASVKDFGIRLAAILTDEATVKAAQLSIHDIPPAELPWDVKLSVIAFGLKLTLVLTDEERAKAKQLARELHPEPPCDDHDVATPEKAGSRSPLQKPDGLFNSRVELAKHHNHPTTTTTTGIVVADLAVQLYTKLLTRPWNNKALQASAGDKQQSMTINQGVGESSDREEMGWASVISEAASRLMPKDIDIDEVEKELKEKTEKDGGWLTKKLYGFLKG